MPGRRQEPPSRGGASHLSSLHSAPSPTPAPPVVSVARGAPESPTLPGNAGWEFWGCCAQKTTRWHQGAREEPGAAGARRPWPGGGGVGARPLGPALTWWLSGFAGSPAPLSPCEPISSPGLGLQPHPHSAPCACPPPTRHTAHSPGASAGPACLGCCCSCPAAAGRPTPALGQHSAPLTTQQCSSSRRQPTQALAETPHPPQGHVPTWTQRCPAESPLPACQACASVWEP